MRRLLLSFILLFFGFGHSAKAENYDNIEISLLTASPGNELYSVFGHSALRVRNMLTGSDTVYNYGLFSFSDPNFYFSFLFGKLNYWLGTESYNNFYNSYTSENRGITEQVFDMDASQKQFVLSFLEENLKEENKYYSYHFFEDNCSTRIRDLISLTYQDLEYPPALQSQSYRMLVDMYIQGRPWVKLGIDIVLGRSTDKTTTLTQQMFLPDYLFYAFADAKVNGHPLVKQTNVISTTPAQSKIKPLVVVSPFITFCAILGFSVLFSFVKNGRRVFDFILFLSVGFLGIIILSLWAFSNHPEMQTNYNIIWAFPIHGIVAFLVLSDSAVKFTKNYFFLTAIVNLILLATWALLPQRLNPALIPLVLSIVIRAWLNYRKENARKRKQGLLQRCRQWSTGAIIPY